MPKNDWSSLFGLIDDTSRVDCAGKQLGFFVDFRTAWSTVSWNCADENMLFSDDENKSLIVAVCVVLSSWIFWSSFWVMHSSRWPMSFVFDGPFSSVLITVSKVVALRLSIDLTRVKNIGMPMFTAFCSFDDKSSGTDAQHIFNTELESSSENSASRTLIFLSRNDWSDWSFSKIDKIAPNAERISSKKGTVGQTAKRSPLSQMSAKWCKKDHKKTLLNGRLLQFCLWSTLPIYVSRLLWRPARTFMIFRRIERRQAMDARLAPRRSWTCCD